MQQTEIAELAVRIAKDGRPELLAKPQSLVALSQPRSGDRKRHAGIAVAAARLKKAQLQKKRQQATDPSLTGRDKMIFQVFPSSTLRAPILPDSNFCESTSMKTRYWLLIVALVGCLLALRPWYLRGDR